VSKHKEGKRTNDEQERKQTTQTRSSLDASEAQNAQIKNARTSNQEAYSMGKTLANDQNNTYHTRSGRPVIKPNKLNL
jgi:hypothetical protein